MPQKLRCEVAEILDHGGRVYSVFLKPDSTAPRFLPGQFLHLALDEYTPGDFWPDSRVFSIASSPSDRQLLRITYAVKGQFTGRLEAELHAGRYVWIKMPYGEFIVNAENDICLLAGGTGVTAFTAFLSGLGADYPHVVSLFYGARRPDLLIYRSLVELAAARCPKLRPFCLAEENPGPGCIPGRIDLDVVWQHLPDPLAVTYYMAGPPEMMSTLAPALRQRGVVDGKVIADAWE
jgi:ferredoxin-NADP reductase